MRVRVGPRADFNGDQLVDDRDRDDFSVAFSEGDWRADFNDDGVIDARDNDAFLAAWNEEALPVVTVTPPDAKASEPGTDTGRFLFTRTGSTGASLTVLYSISGTATNGTDYQTLTGTARFGVDYLTKRVYVTPIDDP